MFCSSLQCLNENWTSSIPWNPDLLWQKVASNFANYLMRSKACILFPRLGTRYLLSIISLLQIRLSIYDGRDDPSSTAPASSISRLEGYGAYSVVRFSYIFLYDFIKLDYSPTAYCTKEMHPCTIANADGCMVHCLHGTMVANLTSLMLRFPNTSGTWQFGRLCLLLPPICRFFKLFLGTRPVVDHKILSNLQRGLKFLAGSDIQAD